MSWTYSFVFVLKYFPSSLGASRIPRFALLAQWCTLAGVTIFCVSQHRGGTGCITLCLRWGRETRVLRVSLQHEHVRSPSCERRERRL